MLELNSANGQSFRCLITNSGAITLLLGGKTYNVNTTHHAYNDIKQAINNRDIDWLTELLNTEKVVKAKFDKVASGKVEVKNGGVYYNGEQLHSYLCNKILQFLKDGLPFEPLVRFLENLLENPSKRAVDELYGFLEACNIPITSDGFFLSYKSVRFDYYDKYTATILNKPGTIVEVPRNTVSDDCSKFCDFGLHVGGLAYSGPGGWYNNPNDKIVVVEINPKDVVSVPLDHNFHKMRVCRYEVLRDFDVALDKPLYEANNEGIDEYTKKETVGKVDVNRFCENYGPNDCYHNYDDEDYDDDEWDELDNWNDDDSDNDSDDDYDDDKADDCCDIFTKYCKQKKDTTMNHKYQQRDSHGRFIKK